ncbi:MAG TPA: hypothetical protein VH519_15075, partial [Hyphomicrobiaceae bacterium]
MPDEPKSTPARPPFPTLHEYIEYLGRTGNAAHALIAAAKLETALTELIQARLPNLFKTEELHKEHRRLDKRLFRSFATKIDVAFAMGEIDG